MGIACLSGDAAREEILAFPPLRQEKVARVGHPTFPSLRFGPGIACKVFVQTREKQAYRVTLTAAVVVVPDAGTVVWLRKYPSVDRKTVDVAVPSLLITFTE